MPLMRGYQGKDADKVGYFKWGKTGEKHYYAVGDEVSILAAKTSALAGHEDRHKTSRRRGEPHRGVIKKKGKKPVEGFYQCNKGPKYFYYLGNKEQRQAAVTQASSGCKQKRRVMTNYSEEAAEARCVAKEVKKGLAKGLSTEQIDANVMKCIKQRRKAYKRSIRDAALAKPKRVKKVIVISRPGQKRQREDRNSNGKRRRTGE